MNSTTRQNTVGRIGATVRLWGKTIPKLAIILVFSVPIGAWAFRSALGSGADIVNNLLMVLILLAVQMVGAACSIAALEAVRANKANWLQTGVTTAFRLFGWELLATFQSMIRFFIPFLPPSARRPEEYQPSRGTAAYWFDRLPVTAGILHMTSKLGLRMYVAVLTKKDFQECMAYSKGRYLHLFAWNALSGIFHLGIMGVLSDAQKATGQLPPLGMLLFAFLLDAILASLFAAYGLLLFQEARTELKNKP